VSTLKSSIRTVLPAASESQSSGATVLNWRSFGCVAGGLVFVSCSLFWLADGLTTQFLEKPSDSRPFWQIRLI